MKKDQKLFQGANQIFNMNNWCNNVDHMTRRSSSKLWTVSSIHSRASYDLVIEITFPGSR